MTQIPEETILNASATSREFGSDVTLPTFHGEEWVAAELPQGACAWPRSPFGDYDAPTATLTQHARVDAWKWPDQEIHFLSDLRGDADAFWASLVATGRVEKNGSEDGNFRVLAEGKRSHFILGGGLIPSGMANFRLLDAIASFKAGGAKVTVLAGNSDIGLLMGLHYLGRKEPHLAHLFVRMGKQIAPFLKEVWSQHLENSDAPLTEISEAEAKRRLWPDDSWFEHFPASAEGLLGPSRLSEELLLIRAATEELEPALQREGMTLAQTWHAAEKARSLFLDENGAYAWFGEEMKLAARHGAFLFVHAGVDDEVARVLQHASVSGLNRHFRALMDRDIFTLFYGPVGNAFRTRYSPSDPPLTERGQEHLRAAGLHVIVHGNIPLLRGQRFLVRSGMLNLAASAAVDRITRSRLGLIGAGAAALSVRPAGTIIGISSDEPLVKVCRPRVAFPAAEDESSASSDPTAGVSGGAAKLAKRLDYKTAAHRNEISEWLYAVAEGVASGKLSLTHGKKRLRLEPATQIDVSVLASRKKSGKEALSFEISWRAVAENTLRIEG